MMRLLRLLRRPSVRRRLARHDEAVFAVVVRHRFGAFAYAAANELDWPVEQAHEALERLAAAGRVEASWADGRRRYRAVEGSW